MAVINYRKFKVLIDADSPKEQGLRTGDIVRRLYFNGNNVIYTLMCVLDYGIDEVTEEPTGSASEEPAEEAAEEVVENTRSDAANEANGEASGEASEETESDDEEERVSYRQYFIGALLEGDAPVAGQILDFIRVTNIFDSERGGALCLNSLGQHHSCADVIGDIGKSCSLCWPSGLPVGSGVDPSRQYVPDNNTNAEYIAALDGNRRVCHITGTRTSDPEGSTVGISQEFYQNVAEGDKVIISYMVKAGRDIDALATFSSFGASGEPPSESFTVTDEWTYRLHVVTVENPGRLLRTFGLSFDGFVGSDEIWIAGLNIIQLSSLSAFSDSSLARFGRIEGTTDVVFGRVKGYGAHVRRMFATGASHVSGTLTPGDAGGFGSTFYAGRIHRNAFINSIAPTFVGDVPTSEEVVDPTGTSLVHKLVGSSATMVAQSALWLANRVGLEYSFSFWAYANKACEIEIKQNGTLVGTVQIGEPDIDKWLRLGVSFNLLPATQGGDGLLLRIEPSFNQSQQQQQETGDRGLEVVYVTAPQLEAGGTVTQYQPTDDTLNYTDEFGAWFNRGGLGGTIQNPLLILNADGEGSIGAMGNSVMIRPDGSGHIAQENISWDEEGNVNFSGNIQNILGNKYIHIIGSDTFMLIGDLSGNTSFTPSSILLRLNEFNLTSTPSQRAWYYLHGTEWIQIEGEEGLTLEITPNSSYWGNSNALTIKAEVTMEEDVLADSITLRKEYLTGYSVEIVSSQGETFMNGQCQTVLTANVFYQGLLVDPEYVAENFVYYWRKYDLPDHINEVDGWWQAIYDDQNNLVQPFIDRTARSISLNCPIQGSDLYTCELQLGVGFPFTFPVVF